MLDYQLRKGDITLFVSIHLPVKVYKDAGIWKCERTKHVSTEALYAKRGVLGTKILFVGSCPVKCSSQEDRKQIEKLLSVYDCIPIFQDTMPTFGAYSEFCETFLWPVMNNQLPLQENTEILMWDEDLWRAYRAANELFCAKVMSLISELNLDKDSESFITVWANEFHLFLLPALLRKRLTMSHKTSMGGSTSSTPPVSLVARVALGLFIHTPFPTSEIFLTLPVRSELMRGLLSADLVGFQFYDYTRHFFSGAQKLFGVRATCQRGGLLALEVSEDRNVFIHITHNCIEHEYVVDTVSSRTVQRRAAALREEFKNRVVIGSLTRLSRTAGILLKLRAFRLFLQQYEQYHNRVVLVLYMISRGEHKTTPEHAAIASQATALADEINAEFGFHVQVKQSVDEIDRSSLLCITDIFLDTSLKDGLNLVPFEYLAARDAWLKLEGTLVDLSAINTISLGSSPLAELPTDELEESSEEEIFGQGLLANTKHTGRIVISEFTGSSQVLPGALRVNPWHVDTILSALDESLTMPAQLAHQHFIRDGNYVASQSQVNWAKEFASQIVRAAMANERSLATQPIVQLLSQSMIQFKSSDEVLKGDKSPTPASSNGQQQGGPGLPKLSRDTVLTAYKKASKGTRVLFLDNEGTLAPNMSRIYRHYGSAPLANPDAVDLQAKGCGPSEEVLKLLSVLCQDPANYVMILSGRPKNALGTWFGPLVAKGLVGLAAEHGYYWMHPRITNGNWECLLDTVEEEGQWVPQTEEIMNRYVNRTPNTYIENKGSAVVWQFRDAESEFGYAQAKELHAELEIALRSEAVDITTGKGYVEVKLRGVNKGAAVAKFLDSLPLGTSKPEFLLCIGDDRSDESMFEELLVNQNAFTATVGRKKSMAKYFLSDVEHVSALLAVLAEASKSTPE
jgi:trehalose 6-phosphate synthase/phosphatase